MTQREHVVIWDPSGKFWDGAVVSAQDATVLRTRGVCTLPCDSRVFGMAGFAGYARRGWGSGWPLDGVQPRFCAPISIHYPSDAHRELHWAARLYPAVPEVLTAEHRLGVLRLAAGDTTSGQNRPAVSEGSGRVNQVEIPAMGAPDAHGGWTIGGRAITAARVSGMHALGIYGYAPGMRLAWLAVTLTP